MITYFDSVNSLLYVYQHVFITVSPTNQTVIKNHIFIADKQQQQMAGRDKATNQLEAYRRRNNAEAQIATLTEPAYCFC